MKWVTPFIFIIFTISPFFILRKKAHRPGGRYAQPDTPAPPGCRLHPRCLAAMMTCERQMSQLTYGGTGYLAARHLY
jgi:hypothetical protein